MKLTNTLIVTACAGLFLTGPALAQVVIEFEQADAAQVLNVKTTGDWTAAAIVIELDLGSIVQDRYFAANETTGASDLDLPAVASATGPEGFGKPVFAAGAADSNLGGEQLWLDSRRMDLCWYNLSQDDVGWGRIGRFTLSDDAVGTWRLAVTQAGDDPRSNFSGKIIHGRFLIDP